MHKDEGIYTTLCVLFLATIVIGNLIYQKFVSLPLLPFHTFELSVGAILYHLTFLITDLITEFYGKDKASFCIKLGIAINIFVAITIACMDYLEATSWSKIDNILFHKVFGFFSVSFLGSIIACYISKKLSAELFNQNVTLITKIKKKMKNCLMDMTDKIFVH